MDCSKVGALIRALREEAGLTQLQLAEKLGVSDRAVSKWECGRGAPDVTLLGALSAALKVNVEGLLAGELPGGAEEGGNMKKAKWYVCPACGGLTVSSGGAEARCCGRPLGALEVQKPDEAHALRIEPVEDEKFVTAAHPMEREHSITFAALASGGCLKLWRAWPHWDLQVRLPREHGLLLWHCSRDGLFGKNI